MLWQTIKCMSMVSINMRKNGRANDMQLLILLSRQAIIVNLIDMPETGHRQKGSPDYRY